MRTAQTGWSVDKGGRHPQGRGRSPPPGSSSLVGANSSLSVSRHCGFDVFGSAFVIRDFFGGLRMPKWSRGNNSLVAKVVWPLPGLAWPQMCPGHLGLPPPAPGGSADGPRGDPGAAADRPLGHHRPNPLRPYSAALRRCAPPPRLCPAPSAQRWMGSQCAVEGPAIL